MILVRNEEAKRSVPGELQNALILTIVEAKGLEFDDVCYKRRIYIHSLFVGLFTFVMLVIRNLKGETYFETRID